MPLVTNHMLRKKLVEVQRESSAGISSLSSSNTNGTNTTNQGDELVPVSITEKTINRVQGDEFIATDGTRGKLYYPLPGIKWVCHGVAGSNGMVTLEKQLTGLFISDGGKSFCLGVWGDTTEFEVLLQVGENEIRLNELFLNFNANMCVKNGLEANL